MKRLLFIGPKFYNYHLTIKQGFERAGFEVDYFDDRPDTNFLTKALVRINKKLINKKIKAYFKTIMDAVSEKSYDVVFVLYGQSFSKEMMKELKNMTPKSRFIFYMFDPFFSMPDREQFQEVFDDCYSFDYLDCKKNNRFELVPLFYSFDDGIQGELKYDACFLSTMMPNKYEISKSLISQLKDNNYSIYEYKYLQSKSVWLYYKLFKKDFKHSKKKDFAYFRLDNKLANQVLLESKIIIDCPKEGQSGLTIRTFEALAANKKLITTNKTIVNYDFYKPENIYVFDGKVDFNNIFFKSDYVPISSLIKQNYSIDNWVKKILKNYNSEV